MEYLDWVDYWQEVGIYDVLLPFLLVFTLTFAVLQKSQLLGKDTKNLNVIISIITGFLFIRNAYLVGLINRFLPNVSMFMIILLMFLLLVGIFAGSTEWKGGLLGLATLLSIVFIIWALSADYLGDWSDNVPGWLTSLSDQTKATLLFVGIFVIIIAYVTHEPKEEKKGFLDWISKGMGKKE